MSSISGGRGPEGPKNPNQPQKADGNDQQGRSPLREAAAKENVSPRVIDGFERAAPQLSKQLQNIAGKAAVVGGKVIPGNIQFSSEVMAELAVAFAQALGKNPRANRKERANMFARAILKRRKLRKLFESADEEDVEEMFDTIAEQIDNSPVLAQLVDDVTEGARKIHLG